MPIDVMCLKGMEIPIISMDWYNGKFGHIYSLCPTLAVCYENGFLQLMCNESDPSTFCHNFCKFDFIYSNFPDPIIVDTKMNATNCVWNHNGSLIAIAGQQHQREENKVINIVQFFSPFGDVRRIVLLELKLIFCLCSIYEH